MPRNHGSRRFHFLILWAVAALLGAGLFAMGPALAGDYEIVGESEGLAEEAQNPVGNLINLRFESNSSFDAGPEDSYLNVHNIIPVYPSNLNSEWNWISRGILPVIYAEDLGGGQGSEFGIGDFLYQGYLSPAKPGKLIWGLGPAALMPTGKDEFTSDRWSLGPTAVALATPGHFVLGLLGTQLWSVDDSNDPDVSLFTLQYFINYNMPDGWYLTSTPIISADWEEDSNNRWTVPVGGGMGRLFKIGNQSINARLQAYRNIERRDGAPTWTIQAQLTFLFPK